MTYFIGARCFHTGIKHLNATRKIWAAAGAGSDRNDRSNAPSVQEPFVIQSCPPDPPGDLTGNFAFSFASQEPENMPRKIFTPEQIVAKLRQIEPRSPTGGE